MELTEEQWDYIDWLGVGQAIVSLKRRVQVPLHVVSEGTVVSPTCTKTCTPREVVPS